MSNCNCENCRKRREGSAADLPAPEPLSMSMFATKEDYLKALVHPTESDSESPAEPVAWLWKDANHAQAFVTEPPPSMLRDPRCTPLYAEESIPVVGCYRVEGGLVVEWEIDNAADERADGTYALLSRIAASGSPLTSEPDDKEQSGKPA